MNKLKLMLVAITTLTISACTPTTTGLRDGDLLRPEYIRQEKMLHMTFPEIQSALFKHDRICGNAPVFRMKENATSYATITEANIDEMPWNQVIVFDLMWLQESKLNETRTKVFVHSFFSDADVKRRINNMFSALDSPETCISD